MLVYPVEIYDKKPEEKYHIAYVPDFNIATQGKDIAECISMSRDLIGNEILRYEKTKEDLPKAFSKSKSGMFEGVNLNLLYETLIDIDIKAFKRKNSQKMVKKNCTIPSYLAYEAEEKGINFSKVLQEALVDKLSL